MWYQSNFIRVVQKAGASVPSGRAKRTRQLLSSMTTKIPSSFSSARTALRWPREVEPSKLISRSVENDPDVGSKIHLVVAVHGAVQLAVRCLDVCPTDKQIWEHKPYRRRLR
jgi:hypothetical protein